MTEPLSHCAPRRELVACRHEIGHLDGLGIDNGPTGHPIAPEWKFRKVDRDRAEMRGDDQRTLLLQQNRGVIGRAEPRRVFRDCLQDGLDVGG
jgi:hypothetical protein